MDVDVAETVYWRYSTIAQTLGAILGVGGMLCVFRLTTLRESRWHIINRMSELNRALFGEDRLPAKEILKRYRGLERISDGRYELNRTTISSVRTQNGDFLYIRREDGTKLDPVRYVDIGMDLYNLEDVHEKEKLIELRFIRLLKTNLSIIGLSILALILCRVLAATPLLLVAIGLTLWGIPHSFNLTIKLCIAVIGADEQEQKDYSRQ